MISTTSLLLAGFGVLSVTLCPSNRVQRFTLDFARYLFRLGQAAFLIASLGLCLWPNWVPDDVAVRLLPLADPLTKDCGERFRWLAMAAIVCVGTTPALVLLDFLSTMAHHMRFDRETLENSQRILAYLYEEIPSDKPTIPMVIPKTHSPKAPVRRLGEYVS